jgi:hypothetical protein
VMARQSPLNLLSFIVARVASRGGQGTIPRRGETGYSLLSISENGSTNDRFRGDRSASMLVAVPPGCGINYHTSTGLALSQPRQRGLAGYGKAKPTGSNTTGCLLDL